LSAKKRGRKEKTMGKVNGVNPEPNKRMIVGGAHTLGFRAVLKGRGGQEKAGKKANKKIQGSDH